MHNFTLRATTEDNCGAIIQTFHSKWERPLLDGAVKVVFRKQGPSQFQPRLMYLYLTKPIKAIIGKCDILSYERVPVSEAMRLADEGAIDNEELRSYSAGYGTLLVMRIGKVAKAKSPMTFAYLAEKFDFWPSSTFIPLSSVGEKTLDILCDFGESI